MAKTSIEWTECSWNPVTGCSKVSPGCQNCYAARMTKRLQAMGQPRYQKGFEVAVHEDALAIPLSWKKPRMIFVNSMSDLFHEDVPLAFIRRVFRVMTEARQHTFQVLTKRAQRLSELSSKLEWPPNVWMGVSVETNAFLHRIGCLQTTDAAVKFLSLEPLLGPMDDLDLEGIDWVIVGGESGPGARPMDPDWVRGIRDRCQASGTPFFFKQWGGVFKKNTGRQLDGRTWDEWPSPKLRHDRHDAPGVSPVATGTRKRALTL